MINRIREARRDDETDEVKNHPYRLRVQAREKIREARLEDARHHREENRRRKRRGRMRTVSREDELVERAANPRTGIASPFITSEDSSRSSLETDYIAVSRMRAAKDHQTRNMTSGRWQQDSTGWSIVESPMLSPIAQRTGNQPGDQVPDKTIEDKLQAQMIGTEDLEPDIFSNEDVLQRQESIEQLHNHGDETKVCFDAGILPSLRQRIPAKASTPPNKLHNIRGKEIGNNQLRGQHSDETVMVSSEARHPYPSMLGHPEKAQQHVRIIIPSQTTLNQSPKTAQDHWTTPSDTRSPHSPTTRDSNHYSAVLNPACRQLSPTDECPKDSILDASSASPTFSKYLPRLNLIHPSQISNLAASSYRRPAHLLPPRLRPMNEKKRAMEDACIVTATITSTTPPKKDLRPRPHRQDGLGNTQKASPSALNAGVRGQHLAHRTMRPAQPKARTSPNKAVVATASEAPIQSAHMDRIIQKDPLEAIKVRNTADMGGAQTAARAAMLEDNCLQEIRKGLPPRKRESSPLYANIVRHKGRQDQIIEVPNRTSGRRGDKVGAAGEEHGPMENRLKTQRRQRVFDGYVDEGGVYSKGHWVNEVETKNIAPPPHNLLPPLARHRPLVETAKGTKQWPGVTESWIQTSLLIAWTQHKSSELSLHVLGTLRGAPAAVNILRTPKRTRLEHLKAVKDIVAAGFYLLLFANLCITLGKAFLIVLRALYWISHPFLLVSTLIRWSILG